MKKLYLFLIFATLSALGVVNAAEVTDVLTKDNFSSIGTSYAPFSNVTSKSDAVYAGCLAINSNKIQLNSSSKKVNNIDYYYGIVTTQSGGVVKKITVTWNSSTSNGRVLNVYGKNAAYSATASEFASGGDKGTLLGTITKGTTTELVVEGDYTFIGLRSNSGAMYLDEIQIVWEAGEVTNVATPIITPSSGTYIGGVDVAISCNTEGAQIKYTVNGGVETDYTGTAISLTGAGSYSVKAWAVDPTNTLAQSSEATADYVVKTISYEKLDPANVKPGRYAIAYPAQDGTGDIYLMKNELVSQYYPAATAFDLTGTELPADDNLFTVTATDGGYAIQDANGGYVTLLVSGGYTNVKLQQSTADAAWTFADASNGGTKGTYGTVEKFLTFADQHKNYTVGTDESLCPTFYFISDPVMLQVAAPTFSLENGATYTDDQSLTISTETPGATIHYTVVGDVTNIVDTATETVTIPFTSSETVLVEAYATKDGMTQSETANLGFTIAKKCATPTLSLAAGTYAEEQTVTITGAEGTTIMYSLNENVQVSETNTAVVQLPVVAGAATTYTLTAIACKDGYADSEEVTAVYVIDPSYVPDNFTLVKDVNLLTPGTKIVFAGEVASSHTWYAMAGQNSSNYRNVTPITVDGEIITDPQSARVFEVGMVDGYMTFKDEEGYIGGYTSSNKMGSYSEISDLTKWTVTIDADGVAVPEALEGNTTILRFNPSAKRFTCYAISATTGVSPVYIYYRPSTSGVTTVEADKAVVATVAGGVAITTQEAATVSVYTAAGQLVASESVAEGTTTVNLSAGFYIVRVGRTAAKVIVR